MLIRFLMIIGLALFVVSCTGKEYLETEALTEKTVLKGSNSELKLLKSMKKEFDKSHPENNIEILGGGSSRGIEEFIQGKISVVNASRRLTNKEIDVARSNGIENVNEIIFAMDALAIICNPKVRVDSLSIFQVGDIFEGKITNWKEVGGPDHPIKLYGRNPNSGTYGYVLDRLIHGTYAENMVEFEDPDDIVHAVKNDQYGIGYVDLGRVSVDGHKPDPSLWCLNIYIEGGRAFSPFEKMAILNGEYPLIRPFYHFINASQTDIMSLRNFIDFELSPEGQKVVEQNGLYPITDIHKALNNENGF